MSRHDYDNSHNNHRQSWEAIPPDTAAFTPDISPLILAAHTDNYEIIKILLDRGAVLPCPHHQRYQALLPSPHHQRFYIFYVVNLRLVKPSSSSATSLRRLVIVVHIYMGGLRDIYGRFKRIYMIMIIMIVMMMMVVPALLFQNERAPNSNFHSFAPPSLQL